MMVFMEGWTEVPFHYYFDRERDDLPHYLMYRRNLSTGALNEMMELAEGRTRVWVIFHASVPDVDRQTGFATLRALDAEHEQQRFFGIDVHLFEVT